MEKNIELLRAENISYSVPGMSRKVLEIRNLSVNRGTAVFVLGRNGAGKSSLLSFLGGHVSVPDARIFWKGKGLMPVSDRLIPGFHEIAMVKQNPDLSPFLRVEEELLKTVRHLPEALRLKKLKEMIRLCHLKELLSQKTGNLSGGEKRRVALAQALVLDTELILLDEPFSDLDSENRLLFYPILLRAMQEKQVGFIVVSHNGEDAKWLADEIWTLVSGKIREKMKRTESGFQPRKAITARLLGWQNILPSKNLVVSNDAITDTTGWIHIPPQSIFVNQEGNVSLGLFELIRKWEQDSTTFCLWLNARNQSLISEGILSDIGVNGNCELTASSDHLVVLE
ncbi:MAG TPA: ABC transporter ATP-binding protein [Catalimonadaceae bacterium]|nr:ABC transporter ATP-binding protein [Catalimonadaceae bacterium]